MSWVLLSGHRSQTITKMVALAALATCAFCYPLIWDGLPLRLVRPPESCLPSTAPRCHMLIKNVHADMHLCTTNINLCTTNIMNRGEPHRSRYCQQARQRQAFMSPSKSGKMKCSSSHQNQEIVNSWFFPTKTLFCPHRLLMIQRLRLQNDLCPRNAVGHDS